jgi:hypothetical protein
MKVIKPSRIVSYDSLRLPVSASLWKPMIKKIVPIMKRIVTWRVNSKSTYSDDGSVGDFLPEIRVRWHAEMEISRHFPQLVIGWFVFLV